jgi:hypothetical protein
MMNLPNELVAVRRSGRSASEPASSLSDMTFQELSKIPWSETDQRPIAIALVQLFDGPIEPETWKNFLDQRMLY